MYEAGVGVVLTCITKQNMQFKKYVTITVNHNALHTEFKKNFMSRYLEQVSFFAKQVSFEAHLPK